MKAAVVDISSKVPGVVYSVSIEQGPDGVRNVRIHDVADDERSRQSVAFALREAADLVAPPPSSTQKLTDAIIREIWLIKTGTTEQDSPLSILDFARAVLEAAK